jgi:hypothetical protein
MSIMPSLLQPPQAVSSTEVPPNSATPVPAHANPINFLLFMFVILKNWGGIRPPLSPNTYEEIFTLAHLKKNAASG